MNEAQEIVALGKLVLQFARVERVTYHEDGKRKETDTDHTVMLGIIACNIAAKLYPRMDTGKIAQYAFAHDLLETYAGDTPSFNITEEEKARKDAREKEAFETIQKQFTVFPWLAQTIKAYEALADKEARFIKALDKCMPKITHILNGGVYFKEKGTSKEEMTLFFDRQHQTLREGHAKEFPELMVLTRVLMDMTIGASFHPTTSTEAQFVKKPAA